MRFKQPVIWAFNYGIQSPLTKETLLGVLTRATKDMDLVGERPSITVGVNKEYYVGGFDSVDVKIQAKFRGFADAVLIADQIENLTGILKVDDILSMQCLNAVENPEKLQSDHDEVQLSDDHGVSLEIEE